jgi:hypothetical protein
MIGKKIFPNMLIETTATEEARFLSQHRSIIRSDLESKKERLWRWEGKILRRPLNVWLKTVYVSASSE